MINTSFTQMPWAVQKPNNMAALASQAFSRSFEGAKNRGLDQQQIDIRKAAADQEAKREAQKLIGAQLFTKRRSELLADGKKEEEANVTALMEALPYLHPEGLPQFVSRENALQSRADNNERNRQAQYDRLVETLSAKANDLAAKLQGAESIAVKNNASRESIAGINTSSREKIAEDENYLRDSITRMNNETKNAIASGRNETQLTISELNNASRESMNDSDNANRLAIAESRKKDPLSRDDFMARAAKDIIKANPQLSFEQAIIEAGRAYDVHISKTRSATPTQQPRIETPETKVLDQLLRAKELGIKEGKVNKSGEFVEDGGRVWDTSIDDLIEEWTKKAKIKGGNVPAAQPAGKLPVIPFNFNSKSNSLSPRF